MSRNPIERFVIPQLMMPLPRNNDPIPSSTGDMEFLEVYNSSVTCRPEIRQAGVARNLGRAAIEALNEVYNQVQIVGRDGRRDTRSRHDQFTRSLASSVNRGINEMAEDKLWPMFWAVFHQNDAHRPRYTKEASAAFIDGFRSDLNISKADWKWMCQKSHRYLWQYFDMDFRFIRNNRHPGIGHPFNVRWPEQLVRHDIIPQLAERAPMIFPWLREIFKNDDSWRTLDIREFQYSMSDFIDIVHSHGDREVNDAETKKILKAKTWIEFRQKLHNAEGRAQRYGRSPGMVGRDMEAHMQQLMMYGHASTFTTARDTPERGLTVEALERARDMIMRDHMRGPDFIDAFAFDIARQFTLHPGLLRDEPSTKKPEKLDVYTGVQSLAPSEFNAHGCECRLIDTNEKLYEEGTGMGHCIWRMYQTRIRDAKYIAYHVKYAGDDPGHKGWTLGYRLQESNGGIGFTPGEINYVEGTMRLNAHAFEKPKKEPEWKLDQIRGYKNEIPKHKALDAVAEMLLAVIRGDVKPDLYKKETK